MKKKFRVRVEHYAEGKYCVRFAHYRFIPNWRSLRYWFDQGHPSGTECWSLNLWGQSSAEAFAKTLQSMADIEAYYAPFIAEMKAWKAAEKEWWAKNAPYRSKELK